MNRVHFILYALILTSFAVAPVAKSWGNSYGIPPLQTLYDTTTNHKEDILTTVSNPSGSSLIDVRGSHGRYYFRFGYGYNVGSRGHSKGYRGKRHVHKDHYGYYYGHGHGHKQHYKGYYGYGHGYKNRHRGYYYGQRHGYKNRHKGYYYRHRHGYKHHN